MSKFNKPILNVVGKIDLIKTVWVSRSRLYISYVV